MSTIAIVGATGFVGTALTLRLLDQGHHVVALTRDPAHWPLQHKDLKVIKGDLLRPEVLPELLKKVDAAYYLMHGLDVGDEDFEWTEARAATNFAAAATKAKLKKTIYLGGLGAEDQISRHLRSRQLVGDILGLSAAACVEFRASIILGANSTSFEIIKALHQRVPVRPYAPWLETPCQPIALADLLNYLLSALELQVLGHHVVEIGCPQVVPYGELLDIYAKNEGQPRAKLLLPAMDQRLLVPVFELLVPEFSDVGKKLFMSLECPTVVTDRSAEELFPDITPMDLDQAMQQAFSSSETDYPAVWEGDFWKELRGQALLQTRSGQNMLLEKLREMSEGAPGPKSAVSFLKSKIRDRLPRRKGQA